MDHAMVNSGNCTTAKHKSSRIFFFGVVNPEIVFIFNIIKIFGYLKKKKKLLDKR